MKKILAIFLIIVIVTSLTLFVMKILSGLYFFIIAAIIGYLAVKVIPKMKN